MAKLFLIMGKSASGKDTLYKDIVARFGDGLGTVVPYTTRPIREGEQEGVNEAAEDGFRVLAFHSGDKENVIPGKGPAKTSLKKLKPAKKAITVTWKLPSKANLKKMETNSIEDIARKLDLFHNYDDRIVAERIAYNNSQALHILRYLSI